MNALETVGLFLGLALGCVVLAKLLSAGAFRIKRKLQADIDRELTISITPTATHDILVTPELLAELRSELIHDASKRVIRASFQKGNFK